MDDAAEETTKIMALIKGDNFSNSEAEDDPLDGTNGNDTIYGYGGNDDLFGYAGNDTLYGGSDDDDLWGGTGINNLYGGSGEDLFRMTGRASTLSDDYIADFDFGDDRIDVSQWGVSDFSQIRALLGSDKDGNAVFNAYYNDKNHFVTIGDVDARDLESSDFVFSNARASNIAGTGRGDTLFGSSFNDVIHGNGGNDQLLGGTGNDRIYGDAGNDKIFGGLGRDTMTGGSGADTFVFDTVGESGPGSNVRDSITDFTLDIDTIDLSGIDALPKSSGNQEFDWIGRTDDFDAAGQLSYIWSGGTTIVLGNLDNDAASEFQIALNGRLDLVKDDFIL